jgi:hypothetical protein
MSEHFTLTLRIEQVTKPEKSPVYRGSGGDTETTRAERDKTELVNVVIRADTLVEAIDKTIRHLNIERPVQATPSSSASGESPEHAHRIANPDRSRTV